MVSIDSISYGEISVRGKTFYSDIVIWWNGKTALLPKTHLLTSTLLEKILTEGTELIIVGTGIEGTVKIHRSFSEALRKKKIKLLVEKTENAMEIFNGLAIQGKKIIAIMHVTL